MRSGPAERKYPEYQSVVRLCRSMIDHSRRFINLVLSECVKEESHEI